MSSYHPIWLRGWDSPSGRGLAVSLALNIAKPFSSQRKPSSWLAPPPHTIKILLRCRRIFIGSGGGIRTHDQLITCNPQISLRHGLYLHQFKGVSVSSLYGALHNMEVPTVLAYQSYERLSLHRYPKKFIIRFPL